MANGKDLRRIALALSGTIAAPHFDRTAFKVVRTYVTLAADEQSANFKFAHDEQELKCLVAPQIFAPVEGGWGRMGWTCAALAGMSKADLQAALEMAYAHGINSKKKPAKRVK